MLLFTWYAFSSSFYFQPIWITLCNAHSMSLVFIWVSLFTQSDNHCLLIGMFRQNKYNYWYSYIEIYLPSCNFFLIFPDCFPSVTFSWLLGVNQIHLVFDFISHNDFSHLCWQFNFLHVQWSACFTNRSLLVLLLYHFTIPILQI